LSLNQNWIIDVNSFPIFIYVSLLNLAYIFLKILLYLTQIWKLILRDLSHVELISMFTSIIIFSHYKFFWTYNMLIKWPLGHWRSVNIIVLRITTSSSHRIYIIYLLTAIMYLILDRLSSRLTVWCAELIILRRNFIKLPRTTMRTI
jgi:hypothetical protein